MKAVSLHPEKYRLIAWALVSAFLIVIGGILVIQSGYLTGSWGDRMAAGILAAACGANVRLIWMLARSKSFQTQNQ